MISSRLAELYVDLVARDQLKPHLDSVRDRLANVKNALGQAGSSPLTRELIRVQAEFEKVSAQAKLAFTRQQIDYTRSDEGRTNIREQVRAQEQLAAAQKALQREMDVAKHGKFGMVMKDLKGAVGGFREGLERLGGGGAGGVLGPIIGGLGIMSAVAAASPDIFATLTGSVQYLAGSIGRMLLPVVIDIARYLQSAARWVQSLDAATVANIVTATKWAAAFLAVAGAIRVVSFALASMTALNPWLLALAGLAGLAVFVSSMNSAGSESGLGASAVRVSRSGGDSATIHHRPAGAAPLRDAADFLPWLGEHISRRIGLGGHHSIAPTTVERRPGEASEAFTRRVAAHAEYARSGSVRSATGVMAGRSPLEGGGAGGDPLLTARNFQSEFFSIEDQWRKLQQAGASLSPLDTEMMRFAVEGRAYLERIAAATEETAGREPAAAGMGP